MSLGVNLDVNGRLVPADGKLVQMAEHYDKFIMAHELKNPSVWRDRLPKGVFELFNGTSQKSNIFRGSLGPQQGLSDWKAIGPSTKPSQSNPQGYDACAYTPQTYTWGIESVTFGGYETSWTSPVFCVKDLQYVDQAKEQLGLIVKAGSRITDDVKEVFNREQYVKAAVAARKAVVFVEGAIDYLSNSNYSFAYDPSVVDANGNTYITFSHSLLSSISSLNWTLLDQVRAFLADEAPDAAIGMDSGMPVYGLMLDVIDFEKMVYKDPELREDFRYAKPQQLIDGFNMGFKTYRGFALMHDPRQMRFKIKSTNGTTVTATRVSPRKATRDGTIGKIPECNPDYLKAELAVGVIFMNDVIEILVPPTVNNLGSGMTFGPAPGFNGEWTWVNEYDRVYNPLREVGHFFARFQYYVKPLIHSNNATVFLYRRCPQVLSTGCAVEASSDAASTNVGLAADAVAADVDATNKTITLRLVSKLTGGVGDAVTVTDDTPTAHSAVIADASAAPTYVFASSSAFSAYTNWTAAGAAKVSMA